MRDLIFLAIHLIVMLAKLLRPGGVGAVVAENVALRQQLIVCNRSRIRAPNLTSCDRFVLGLATLFVRERRLPRLAVLVSPATLLRFHRALVQRCYRSLFCFAHANTKPGPKGPSAELIKLIVEFKQRNPRFGCVRIAQQISHAFDISIDKDIVRRVLATHYRPTPGSGDGPSWLTLMAQAKDSLWSTDFFRCESIFLRTHWVMVVMDVCTRRIVGFGVAPAPMDGIAVCRMFERASAGQPAPKHISTDNDPLFRFHEWRALLRAQGMDELKSLPHIPTSHPFVERLIGTIRREYLDQTLFWNQRDLERKLDTFRDYYNAHRVHRSLDGSTPDDRTAICPPLRGNLRSYCWKKHCRGLFQLPVAS